MSPLLLVPLLVAAAGEPRVEASCEAAAKPGRVRCTVDARAPEGTTLAWGDVEVVGAPAFAVPLKGRVPPADATARDAAAWRWTFAMLARETGSGEVKLRVRVVLCRERACTPALVEATAPLHVG